MASLPGDYVYFKALVPLHHISIGTKEWRYYDFGPKSVPPLVCLSGTAGTADVFYKQILFLSMKGYRVIAADAPPVWSHQEWANSFEKFLDSIDVHHIHIYGTSLGGFLAQFFAQYRPRRVKSLVLSNTFMDTRYFCSAMSWSSLINWMPEFLLKRYILSGIREGPHEPLIADSIDFVVNQLESLSREELASRLTLNTIAAAIGQILVPDSCITIMDTNDYCAIPQTLKEEVGARYPGARRAFLKSGGDFLFLSRPDEVNLHLQLHLRRVGLEAHSEPSGPGYRDNSGDSASGEDETDDNDQFRRKGRQFQGGELSPESSTGSVFVADGQLARLDGEQTANREFVAALLIDACSCFLWLYCVHEPELQSFIKNEQSYQQSFVQYIDMCKNLLYKGNVPNVGYSFSNPPWVMPCLFHTCRCS